MSMLKNKGADGSVGTFIGPAVKVKGDFSGEGDLVVEGMVVGNLTTKNDLRIGSEAAVEAKISAKNAHIAGQVLGNVIVKGKLELTSTARIIGDVKCTILSVETGGVINGQIDMQADKKTEEREEKVEESKVKK